MLLEMQASCQRKKKEKEKSGKKNGDLVYMIKLPVPWMSNLIFWLAKCVFSGSTLFISLSKYYTNIKKYSFPFFKKK